MLKIVKVLKIVKIICSGFSCFHAFPIDPSPKKSVILHRWVAQIETNSSCFCLSLLHLSAIHGTEGGVIHIKISMMMIPLETSVYKSRVLLRNLIFPSFNFFSWHLSASFSHGLLFQERKCPSLLHENCISEL